MVAAKRTEDLKPECLVDKADDLIRVTTKPPAATWKLHIRVRRRRWGLRPTLNSSPCLQALSPAPGSTEWSTMTYVDNLKTSTHDDMKNLAAKHGAFESFLQDVQRMAEKAWHNARSQGHDPSSIVGDAEKTVSDLEQDVTDAEIALAEARTALRNATSSQTGDSGTSAATPVQPAGDDVNGANAAGDGGVVTGPTGEPAEGAQVTTGPTDDGTETKPADPASPVSDGGFPTSNVGVSQPVQPSTPVNP